MQSWRKSNEDAHITALDFQEGISLFAVFDGHGGSEVAKYCERNFLKMLQANEDFQKGEYEKALKTTFVGIDRQLLTKEGKKELEKIGRQDAPPGGY